MAEDSPLLHDGWSISTGDYRNSTLSGTTHMGYNGSAQYQAVRLTTAGSDSVIGLCTAAGQAAYGILQNKPGVGGTADVGIFGLSKAVAGTTTVTAGIKLMVDSSGCLIPYASAAGQVSIGYAKTSAAAVGEVFTAVIYGYGAQGSVA